MPQGEAGMVRALVKRKNGAGKLCCWSTLQDARAALELDCLVVRCALPVAAAFVGACSAWWRLVLCLAWPSRLEAEAAALSVRSRLRATHCVSNAW